MAKWLTNYGCAAGRKKKDKEDTFGQNDDDWHIYREIVIECVCSQ